MSIWAERAIFGALLLGVLSTSVAQCQDARQARAALAAAGVQVKLAQNEAAVARAAADDRQKAVEHAAAVAAEVRAEYAAKTEALKIAAQDLMAVAAEGGDAVASEVARLIREGVLKGE